MDELPRHDLAVALVRPQIPQNVGNVARTCVITGTCLHLARPFPFVLEDRRLQRAGLDYWPRLRLNVHQSELAVLEAAGSQRTWLFDSSGRRSLFDVPFAPDDWLIFGSETLGLSARTLAEHRDRTVRIPQVREERCLNLATSVGVALYTALGRLSGSGHS